MKVSALHDDQHTSQHAIHVFNFILKIIFNVARRGEEKAGPY
jgi:hypothetical protein